jgi:competence protein ComEC
MKRPLVGFAIALIFGIILSSIFKSIIVIVIFICVGVIAVFLINRLSIVKITFLISMLVFFAIGSFEFYFLNNLYTHRFDNFVDNTVEILAAIDSPAELSPKTAVYIVSVKQINMNEKIYNITGKLKLRAMLSDDKMLYQYGDEVFITGIIELSKVQRNPSGFNYRQYLANCGISGEIFAGNGNLRKGSGNYRNILINSGYVIRKGIISTINQLLGEKQAGLLNGMLVGERSGLNREVKQEFSDAGLTHIMAVSGMNVAFVIIPFMFIFKRLRFSLRLSNSLAILSIMMFVFITGFSASVLRASIMATVILLAQILYREGDVYSSLSFAAIILLVVNPGTLFDIGFQLSFAATLSLVLFYKRINEITVKIPIPKLISETIAVTIAAQILVTPLGVLYFNRFSIISVITNLLVVPLCQNITIIGFAMAGLGQFSIQLAGILGMINDFMLSFILLVTKYSSDIPFSAIQLTTPSLVLILIYYVCIAYLGWWCFVKGNMPDNRFVIAVAGAILIIFLLPIVKPPSMEVVFLDVGEGDSIFVKTVEGKKLLIDGGGFKKSTPDAAGSGEITVIPFLLDYGIDYLDLVISSHPHEDHMQGLVSVSKSLGIGGVIEPEGMPEKDYKIFNSYLNLHKIPIKECSAGDVIKIDSKTYIEIFYPFKSGQMEGKSIEEISTDVNERSLIFKLVYDKVSILFTADMDGKMEKELLDEGFDVESDVIKVAHHGSRSASTTEFLEKVKSKAAIISVGRNNYGHPSPRTLDRLEASGASIFRTDECGGIILETDGQSIRVKKTIE